MIIGLSGKKQHGKNTVAEIIQWLTQDISDRPDLNNVDLAKQYVGKKIPLGTRSNWQEKAFALKLKQVVCLLIGCTMEQLEDPSFKESWLGPEWECYVSSNHFDGSFKLYPIGTDLESIKKKGHTLIQKKMSPRMILQLMGTEYGRDIIHPNLWVNSLMADYTQFRWDNIKGEMPNWIITDVRFMNEVNAIKDRGGIVLRVNRPFLPKVCKRCGKTEESHYSVDEENNEVYTDLDTNHVFIEAIDNHPSETALDAYGGFDDWIVNKGTLSELVETVKEVLLKHNILKQ